MPELWGNVSYNRQQGAWCLRGTWQGQRLYFSEYYTAIGPKTCKTEHEARALQQFISGEIANGTFDPRRFKKNRPVHLKKYARKWLDQVKPTLAHGTYKAYRAAVHWIVEIVGDVFIADLNYAHYMKIWTDVPRAPKYRKNILTTFYTLMEDARRAGDIPQCPEKIVFKGKFTIPRKKKDWINRETQCRILDHIPERHRPIFEFIILTGVRPGEARALQKSDVRKDRDEILIRFTFADVPGRGQQLKEVKQKDERALPFYNAAHDIFSRALANVSEFVFINPDTCRPYTKNINRDIWNPACLAAGVSIKLNNAGRHSWGNQMAAKGVDFELIAKGLGHSNTNTTKAHYADPSKSVLKEAVDGKVVRFRKAE